MGKKKKKNINTTSDVYDNNQYALYTIYNELEAAIQQEETNIKAILDTIRLPLSKNEASGLYNLIQYSLEQGNTRAAQSIYSWGTQNSEEINDWFDPSNGLVPVLITAVSNDEYDICKYIVKDYNADTPGQPTRWNDLLLTLSEKAPNYVIKTFVKNVENITHVPQSDDQTDEARRVAFDKTSRTLARNLAANKRYGLVSGIYERINSKKQKEFLLNRLLTNVCKSDEFNEEVENCFDQMLSQYLASYTAADLLNDVLWDNRDLKKEFENNNNEKRVDYFAAWVKEGADHIEQEEIVTFFCDTMTTNIQSDINQAMPFNTTLINQLDDEQYKGLLNKLEDEKDYSHKYGSKRLAECLVEINREELIDGRLFNMVPESVIDDVFYTVYSSDIQAEILSSISERDELQKCIQTAVVENKIKNPSNLLSRLDDLGGKYEENKVAAWHAEAFVNSLYQHNQSIPTPSLDQYSKSAQISFLDTYTNRNICGGRHGRDYISAGINLFKNKTVQDSKLTRDLYSTVYADDQRFVVESGCIKKLIKAGVKPKINNDDRVKIIETLIDDEKMNLAYSNELLDDLTSEVAEAVFEPLLLDNVDIEELSQFMTAQKMRTIISKVSYDEISFSSDDVYTLIKSGRVDWLRLVLDHYHCRADVMKRAYKKTVARDMNSTTASTLTILEQYGASPQNFFFSDISGNLSKQRSMMRKTGLIKTLLDRGVSPEEKTIKKAIDANSPKTAYHLICAYNQKIDDPEDIAEAVADTNAIDVDDIRPFFKQLMKRSEVVIENSDILDKLSSRSPELYKIVKQNQKQSITAAATI